VIAVEDLSEIGLDELGPAALQGRVDTKFALPAGIIGEVVEACATHYHALTVGGRRASRYRTQYYDTRDLALYRAQHSGRLPRRKVRVRTYLDSGDRFLELKLRTNARWTQKTRLALGGDTTDPIARLTELPRPMVGELDGGDLRPIVATHFTRITLVRRDLAERVTLDRLVTFGDGRREAGYPGIVFAEVKQAAAGPSPFLTALRERGFRPASLSKYAIAMVTLDHAPKTNRYKPTLSLLARLQPLHVAASGER
jgi:hypothetical protein